jgi:subtilisin
MYWWNLKKLWILLLAVLILTACPGQPSFTLSVPQAKPGDKVKANLSGMDGRKASVSVANVEAPIVSSAQNSVTFSIPDVPEGEQEVVITSEGKTARGKVTVLPKTILIPSFTLNPTQAAPDDEVTATLSNYSGIDATVSIAGKAATIKSSTSSKVIFTVPDIAQGDQEVIIKSGDKEAKNTLKVLPIPDVVLKLDRDIAERGETVNADITGASLEGATLSVNGVATPFTPSDQDSFSFAVPLTAPAGSQKVILETNRGNAERSLDIFGDIEKSKLTLILKPETNETEFQTQIGALGFTLEDKNIPDSSTNLRFLGLSEGPCSGKLADIDVGDMPLSEAIRELEKIEQNGEGVAFHIDPRSIYGTRYINHLNTIGAPTAHTRGRTGSGVLIAVLDTGVGNGVSDVTELGARLRNDLAYDFVNQDDITIDDFDQIIEGTNAGDGIIEGHGTPIAVLAAGNTSGVAPDAEILPIKTCDSTGKCLSSDVILGMCHAISEAQAEDMPLVINLSLGGDTPVSALEAILDYALSNNVLIAAAAGNEGEFGSPVHYPAAHDLPGLVAVGALEAPSLSCVDFEGQKINPDVSYPVGQGFTDNGTDITFRPFTFSTGEIYDLGNASITGDDANKSLYPNNINSDFAFDFPPEGITLTYFDQGGTENLEVNGDLQVVGALSELNDTTLGGVNLSVTSATVGSGIIGGLKLEGPITQFAIGGQELILDNICPLKTSALKPAIFSTRGTYLDISAPGKAIRSSSPSNVYSDYEGTSFSTPLVAGALALWREANTTATPTDIETKLKDAATDLPFTTSEVGEGLLNLSLVP